MYVLCRIKSLRMPKTNTLFKFNKDCTMGHKMIYRKCGKWEIKRVIFYLCFYEMFFIFQMKLISIRVQRESKIN